MQIETKYNINDEVWFINNNKVKNLSIMAIMTFFEKNTLTIEYGLNSYIGKFKESDLFATKEDLIKSL